MVLEFPQRRDPSLGTDTWDCVGGKQAHNPMPFSRQSFCLAFSKYGERSCERLEASWKPAIDNISGKSCLTLTSNRSRIREGSRAPPKVTSLGQ